MIATARNNHGAADCWYLLARLQIRRQLPTTTPMP
jgi:hypothetical protein